MPPGTAFSIMFVTIGFSCFVWQTLTVGEMLYKSRKPIIGLVLFQAFLGIIVTVVTLLTSLIDIGCNFRLIFSVVGVNVGDMSLQFVLLWKAYLGNNRSKVILILGLIPIFGIAIFILINMTIGKSETNLNLGVCATDYPTFIVIIKASIDCTSNAFLSACFILVIYRHYRTLGILLTKNVLGGNTPIIYTIDWYLASFLIIKQLRQRHNKAPKDQDD
ncbi:uncharacterized protein B0P05DRAFT_485605, partial [Gilbertella persicaria]|uniref:uncharacterized protein n=1 Tax=Gilbertella persicaria TaxID=101096 RepID=UPI00221F1BE5